MRDKTLLSINESEVCLKFCVKHKIMGKTEGFFAPFYDALRDCLNKMKKKCIMDLTSN